MEVRRNALRTAALSFFTLCREKSIENHAVEE